ncbi:MAG: efflux RND transporter periplasmic adaptor subunit, partial [Bacteroidales bacterium]|nr:efflux RND transporter periplasmic adaptor subunit [Bacteroidales bacterium]
MKKIGRIILLIIAVLIVLATFKFLWDESRPEVTVYEIVTPQRGNIESTIVATGNIEPRNKILIKPQISGIISTLVREAGDFVQKDDIIATVKVTTEMGQLNTAESRLNLSEINLSQVKIEFDRQKMLYDNEVISRKEFELAETEYRRAIEERDNAQDALDIIKYGVAKKFSQLSNTQIRSTISGTILNIPVKEGNYVIQSNSFNDGTTIAAVADMTDLIFRGNVDETEVGLLKNDMNVNITIGAITNEVFQAQIEYISPQGIKENGTVLYEIKAALNPQTSSHIRADYSANAEIVIDEARNAIIIPEGSVEFEGNAAYVYVLRTENPQRFDKKEVKLGLSDGVNIEIIRGLSLEDRIRGIE